ncbi:MAG: DNA polymerase III subunit beta [bacterium]|nr:DNA polymerase III subunit beta [bacterium]
MHIRADRDALADAFGRANRGAGVRTALPILQCVLCQTEEGRLNITGSDTEVTIRTWANVEVMEEGSFVVPGRVMTEAIKRMPDGAVSLRSLDGEIELSGNGPAFQIRPLSLEDYPNLPEADLTGAVDLDGDALQEALSQVLVATSRDASRPILTGVLIEESEEGLRLVATDSYRLAIRDIPSVGIKKPALIPARGLRELSRTVADGQMKVAVHDREVVFASELGSLHIRLVEGTFPNYRQLIPNNYPIRIEMEKDHLLEAVGRASVVADEHIPVRLKVTADGVEMSVVRTDLGGEKEMLSAEVTGEVEDLTIAFNSRYLQEGVSAIQSGRVCIEIKESLRPSVIKPPDGDDFLYMLMPVRF